MDRSSEYPSIEIFPSGLESSARPDCGALALQGVSISSGELQPPDRPTGSLRILRVTGIGFAPRRTKYDSFGLIAYHEAQQMTKIAKVKH